MAGKIRAMQRAKAELNLLFISGHEIYDQQRKGRDAEREREDKREREPRFDCMCVVSPLRLCVCVCVSWR